MNLGDRSKAYPPIIAPVHPPMRPGVPPSDGVRSVSTESDDGIIAGMMISDGHRHSDRIVWGPRYAVDEGSSASPTAFDHYESLGNHGFLDHSISPPWGLTKVPSLMTIGHIVGRVPDQPTARLRLPRIEVMPSDESRPSNLGDPTRHSLSAVIEELTQSLERVQVALGAAAPPSLPSLLQAVRDALHGPNPSITHEAPVEIAAKERSADIKRWALLTNDEVADLLGVSRRTLQKWLMGTRVSAKNDRHVRHVHEVLRDAATFLVPRTLRERLFARPNRNTVRAFDLLREGRDENALRLLRAESRPDDKRPVALPRAPSFPPEVLLQADEAAPTVPKGTPARRRLRRARAG